MRELGWRGFDRGRWSDCGPARPRSLRSSTSRSTPGGCHVAQNSATLNKIHTTGKISVMTNATVIDVRNLPVRRPANCRCVLRRPSRALERSAPGSQSVSICPECQGEADFLWGRSRASAHAACGSPVGDHGPSAFRGMAVAGCAPLPFGCGRGAAPSCYPRGSRPVVAEALALGTPAVCLTTADRRRSYVNGRDHPRRPCRQATPRPQPVFWLVLSTSFLTTLLQCAPSQSTSATVFEQELLSAYDQRFERPPIGGGDGLGLSARQAAAVH